jgi:inner membrane protein
VLLGCVLASELPDLDSFLPASDPVLHALYTHRGISHALIFAPVWAACATGIAWLAYRRARLGPVFLFSLLSVLVAHLAADLWTGWGTRILLPFSDRRWSLDYAAVIDPFLTLPLLVGAIWAFAQRRHWRRALVVGLAVATAYMGVRIGARTVLLHRVEAEYARAADVEVFPALLSVFSWRYVAVLPEGYTTGRVSLFGPVEPTKTHDLPEELPPRLLENPTVAEALVWARIPLTKVREMGNGAVEVRVADLRYNMGGDPTLEFVVLVGPGGETLEARMERGGSFGEVYERWKRDR